MALLNFIPYVVLLYSSYGKYYHCLFKLLSSYKNCNRLPVSYVDSVPVVEVMEYSTNTDFGVPLYVWDRTDALAWSSRDGWCSFSNGNSEWVDMDFYGDYDLAYAAYSASFYERPN